MNDLIERVNVVLISDRHDRTSLLKESLQRAGVVSSVTSVSPNKALLARARQSGVHKSDPLPHFFLFDYTNPTTSITDVLRQLAFGKLKTAAPVLVMTSPESQRYLDSGDIDGGKAIMSSPTGFHTLGRKLRFSNRPKYFKALRIFYEYGPILIRAPQSLLDQDQREYALMA